MALHGGPAFTHNYILPLKLLAHILQQKLIGETLQRSVAVRAKVSPNTKLMKAVAFLLAKPGVTPAHEAAGRPMQLPHVSRLCGLCGGGADTNPGSDMKGAAVSPSRGAWDTGGGIMGANVLVPRVAS